MEAKNTGNNNVRPLRQAGEIAPRIPPHNYRNPLRQAFPEHALS